MSEAEQYAALYPERAARIRAEGGLPALLDFGPPKTEIVDDIWYMAPVRSCARSTTTSGLRSRRDFVATVPA